MLVKRNTLIYSKLKYYLVLLILILNKNPGTNRTGGKYQETKQDI